MNFRTHPSPLVAIIVLGLSSYINAETYVFMNAGVEGYGTNINNTYTGTPNLVISNLIQQGNADFGVSAGLGHRISMAPYFIAAEVGSASKPEQFTKTQTSVSSAYTSGGTIYTHNLAVVDQKFNNPLIFSAKVGYFISKRLNAYVGAGIAVAKYELTFNSDDGQSALNTVNANPLTLNYSDTQKVAQFMIGSEYSITPQTSWFMQLTYSMSNENTINDNSATPTNILTFKRTQTSGRVGIVYFV